MRSDQAAPAAGDHPAPDDLGPVRDMSGNVRELRLALVCYGGVSLAVYMHGLTQELQRLVQASASQEAERPLSGTAAVYRGVLNTLAEADGVRTRVVIDVISGTSAGGINGVSLARALATDGQLDPIRTLWMTNADIDELLEPGWPKAAFDLWPAASHVPLLGRLLGPAPSIAEGDRGGFLSRTHGRLAGMVTDARDLIAHKSVPSVLQGNKLSAYIDQGLREIAQNATSSLMPPGHQLDLIVTMTDLVGYIQHVPLGDEYVSERGHRNFITYTYVRGEGDAAPVTNDFADDCAHLLGFSGRASSSFPGAFEPVSLDAYAADVAGQDSAHAFRWSVEMLTRFFRSYILRWKEANPDAPESAWPEALRNRRFVDGGVLDNYPFDHAIAAVRSRRADVQVVRRVLLYLEPDPMKPVLDEVTVSADAPSMLAALKAAGSGIPLEEPILEQIRRVAEMNDAATRLKQIVGDGPRPPEAAAAAGETVWRPQDGPYLRLRLESVAEGLAGAVCRMRRFPDDTNQAVAVHAVVTAWMEAKFNLTSDQKVPWPDAFDFLDHFDAGFHRRRMRFVVDGVIALYKDLGKHPHPTRGELDAVKQELYDGIARLQNVIHTLAGDADLGARVATVFEDTISTTILGRPDWEPQADAPGSLADRIADWLARNPDVDALLGEVRTRMLALLEERSFDAYAQAVFGGVRAKAETWGNEDALKALHDRFDPFQLWDRVIYPITRVYEVGENDIIEVARMSPLDARLLAPPDAESQAAFYAGKIKGAAYSHFGAFLEKPWRENDYLWGRLDAAERLLALLLDTRAAAALAPDAKRLFQAIVAEETANLPDIPETFGQVGAAIGSLGP